MQKVTAVPHRVTTPKSGGRSKAKASSEPTEDQPRGTRERILDVALDLFIEKGFDKTSLREIAEQLGFSKAALYYHFASKDDILMALHQRLHDMGGSVLAQMGDRTPTPEEWRDLLNGFVVEMLSNRKLFLLHERNRAALEHLHTEAHEASHDDMEARLKAVLNDPALPVKQRVRMACSLGAVMGGLLMSGDAFSAVPENELVEMLQGTIGDFLQT
jgi:AcrR family transcriptional regulator